MGLIPVLFIIITISFFIMRLAPGGPFDSEKVLPPQIEQNIKAFLGLDQPLWKQYLLYLNGMVHLNLGVSFNYPDMTVREIIAKAFPTSFLIGITAFSFALLIGIAFGVISALKKGKLLDHLLFSFTVLGVSIPSIVLGPVLIIVVGSWLRLLPVAGWGSFSQLILPALTLSFLYISFIARITRASLLESMQKDFVKTARSVGIGEKKIIFKYVLRGSLLPLISYIGPAFAGVITGSIVIERIFAIPGLGQHFISAALNRDYSLALGTVIFYSVILLIVNLIADLLYVLVDPRISYE